METLTEEQKVARACYCLDHGKPAEQQAADTGDYLQELEKRGLAREREGYGRFASRGWVLTAAGRKMAQAFLKLVSTPADEE